MIRTAILCECGNAKRHPRSEACDECERIDRERIAAESPRASLLAALRHFDWVSSQDLHDALGLGPGTSATATVRVSSMLARLVSEGVIERQRVTHKDFMYRLPKRRAA